MKTQTCALMAALALGLLASPLHAGSATTVASPATPSYEGWRTMSPDGENFRLRVPHDWKLSTPQDKYDKLAVENKGVDSMGSAECDMHVLPQANTAHLPRDGMNQALEADAKILALYAKREELLMGDKVDASRVEKVSGQPIAVLETTGHLDGLHMHDENPVIKASTLNSIPTLPTVPGQPPDNPTIKAVVAIVNLPGTQYILQCRTLGLNEGRANELWRARYPEFMGIVRSLRIDA